jgi:hypothetical protein
MKSSIKGLIVILVIVMSLVLVQGVWARDNIVLTIFKGVVTSDTSADNRTITLDLGTDEDDDGLNDSITIFGMGPSWYWEDEDVSYPVKDEYLKIVASYCEILGDYVGVSVCYLDELDNCTDNLIELRDATTLKPLWNPKAKTTDLSDAAEATGDGEPIEHNYDYNYDKEYDNNYDNKYESSGPNGK